MVSCSNNNLSLLTTLTSLMTSIGFSTITSLMTSITFSTYVGGLFNSISKVRLSSSKLSSFLEIS